jgi:hypothetical protein
MKHWLFLLVSFFLLGTSYSQTLPRLPSKPKPAPEKKEQPKPAPRPAPAVVKPQPSAATQTVKFVSDAEGDLYIDCKSRSN